MAGAIRCRPQCVPDCVGSCFVRRRRTGTSGHRRTTRPARPPPKPGFPSARRWSWPCPRSDAGCHSASQGRTGYDSRRMPCTSSGEYFFDSRRVSQDPPGHPAPRAESRHLRPPTGGYPTAALPSFECRGTQVPLRLASFRCVHPKADEGGIPGRMSTEENAATCVPGRREA
jgi:hypothetical protein